MVDRPEPAPKRNIERPTSNAERPRQRRQHAGPRGTRTSFGSACQLRQRRAQPTEHRSPIAKAPRTKGHGCERTESSIFLTSGCCCKPCTTASSLCASFSGMGSFEFSIGRNMRRRDRSRIGGHHPLFCEMRRRTYESKVLAKKAGRMIGCVDFSCGLR
jgi:hypothetical protein